MSWLNDKGRDKFELIFGDTGVENEGCGDASGTRRYDDWDF